MTRTHRLLAPLAALALTLAACGDDDAKPAAAKPAATPASTMPYGTYTRTLTKQDLARTDPVRKAAGQEAGPHMELPPTGEYRLVISKSEAGDIAKVIDAKDFPIDMYASAADGTLTLEDYVDPGKGAFCGPEVAVEATYRFEVEGSSLRIEASPADPCADRDSMYTGTWAKQ